MIVHNTGFFLIIHRKWSKTSICSKIQLCTTIFYYQMNDQFHSKIKIEVNFWKLQYILNSSESTFNYGICFLLIRKNQISKYINIQHKYNECKCNTPVYSKFNCKTPCGYSKYNRNIFFNMKTSMNTKK